VDRNLTYLDTGAYNGLFEQSIIDPEAEMSMWTIDQSADRMPSELLGPVMDSFDVIRKGYRIPRLHDGEYVAFPGVGAYSTSYSVHCEGLQAPQVRPLPDEISLAIAGQWYP